ncbi:hypothetical protein [Streptomyces sp. NPDC057695]|uniref:hypothetical protein n=1 Tax=Streptomyces sp. NPDC057695 TaxID=3346217 RepID=UPI0036D12522
MPVTLNAHQLGRLIERTAAHIGNESIPRLHGIRLEADDTFLYAIASDRHTLAAARYRHDGPNDDEPFARTLPARVLPLLRQWTADQEGSDPVTLTLTDNRIRLATEHSELVLTADEQEFFSWRGVLRDIIDQLPACAENPFPAFDTRLMARWTTTDTYIRVRVTADRQAALLVGEDFLGAQMPVRSRHDGFDTGLADDLEHVRTLWDGALADTPAAAMPDALPAPQHPDDTSPTVGETTQDLLRQTMSSTHDLIKEINTSPAAVAAHASAGAMAWAAFRYLEALHRADPRLAAQIVADTAEQLDEGALGEYAYDAATEAGYDPEAWQKEFEAHEAARQDQQPAANPL